MNRTDRFPLGSFPHNGESRCGDTRTRVRGFTLIEILVVISIIGVLAGLVGVIINKANQKSMVTNTKMLVSSVVETKARMFFQDFKRYPMSSLDAMRKSLGKSQPYKALQFADGEDINSCNELLYVQLNHPDFSNKLREDDMSMIEPPTGNLDEDSFNETPPGCRDNEAREILDAWGSPIVYIVASDYGKTFRMINFRGQEVEVVAFKRADGSWYNPDSFQVISLGEDGVQNFEEFGDDITSFHREDEG